MLPINKENGAASNYQTRQIKISQFQNFNFKIQANVKHKGPPLPHFNSVNFVYTNTYMLDNRIPKMK
jgi:hypothetical protein